MLEYPATLSKGDLMKAAIPLRGHPMPMRSVYLDYASTTPMDPRVLEAMQPFHRERFGNPSSVHAFGQSARQAGGEARGGIAPVDGAGRVDPDAVRRAIRSDTILASVMHSNNEIGTLQPVADIGRITREAGVIFHCDAAQGLGIVPIDVQALGVDLLSMSAHKRYGPKGVGALYIRKGTPLVRFLHGGSHERNRRAGTHNVPGIVGFGEAVRLALEVMEEEAARLRALRGRMIARLLVLDGVRLNGHLTERLPGNVNVSFRGTDSESLLLALDLAGVAASSGSACTSGSLEPSHVLSAIGLDPETAAGTLRFSLGRWTTDEEIDDVLAILPGILEQVRSAAIDTH